jgi:virginiamycin A acetyltransferase
VPFPDPGALYPIEGQPSVMFIRNLPGIPPNVEIGEFTYYDDPAGPDAFLRNVLYHFDFRGDRLRIGRYCAIATGVQFVMNGGNHRTAGISTFPFPIFEAWRGLSPGVSVGDGSIVATRSVVTRDVPPFAVVGGNPATVIRMRFDEATIEQLLRIAWWDWPVERVTPAIPLISQGDVDALEAFGRA